MYFVAVLFAIIAAALGQIVVQTPLGNTPLTLGPGPVVVSGNLSELTQGIKVKLSTSPRTSACDSVRMCSFAVLFAIIAAALGQIVVQTPLGNSPLPLGPGPVVVQGNSPLPPEVWPGILQISGSHPFGM
uniref:Secreted protein n=1 Tax=Haemonchus contortus TaxID=6289 RepID=A0A7I4YHJ1_HAECO